MFTARWGIRTVVFHSPLGGTIVRPVGDAANGRQLWIDPVRPRRGLGAVFGDREEMLREAHMRVAAAPNTYEVHIFGEHEAAGTYVFFLAPKGHSFASLGFPASTGIEPLPELTFRVLSRIPTFAITAGTAILGIFWVINRRMTLAEDDVSWVSRGEDVAGPVVVRRDGVGEGVAGSVAAGKDGVEA